MIAVMNRADGVSIEAGARENLIGVTSEGPGNIISGNSYNGVLIDGPDTEANLVVGNLIGVDASGLAALPNSGSGVAIWGDAWNNRIGGDSEAERNIISGNSAFGINISNGHYNEIVGNFVGLDIDGLAAIPNGVDGVALINGSQNNTIGPDALGEESNLISGNNHGVRIDDPGTTGNRVQGNVIGTNSNLSPLGNTMDGVYLSFGAQRNTIGPNNYISSNGDDGVGVDTPTAVGNTITRNYIAANGGLGIHLTNSAHNGIVAPTILSAPSGGGDITGTACPDCTVEVFVNEDDEGEGYVFWGSATTDGSGNFSLEVPFLPYPYLTATATDSDDGTSEFSAVYTAMIPVLYENSSKAVDRERVLPGELLTYDISLTNSGTADATATLTDTLPAEVIWVGEANASSGVLTWDGDGNRLLWSGTVGVDATVEIDFQVRVNAVLPDGRIINNAATVNDGADFIFEIEAPRVVVDAFMLYLPLALK
jgi:uncharacterized repeat protein (TIGR01451 family)